MKIDISQKQHNQLVYISLIYGVKLKHIVEEALAMQIESDLAMIKEEFEEVIEKEYLN